MREEIPAKEKNRSILLEGSGGNGWIKLSVEEENRKQRDC